jgi:ABC-type nitrate/sulfonate/bicarbonate transport system substrate-binding protein
MRKDERRGRRRRHVREKKEKEANMRTTKRTTRVKALLAACMAALSLGAVGLAGCASGDGQEGAKQDEAPASESQEALEPVSVAYLNKAGYETIIVADKKGCFDAAPMDVELLTVSGSGQQSVEALLAGSADIAATGQGPVADALGQYGDDIVVLCGTNCNTNSQVIVAAPSMAGDTAITPYDKASDNKAEVKASFEAAAAVLGRPVKLGVQQGATTESAVKSWMSAMGVSVNDFGTEGDGTVTLVDVKANTLPTVLAAGSDIDLMAASQPYPDTALSAAPGSYRVGSNADTNSYDVAAYITTKEVYEKKEASLKEFVKALDQATDYMADSANEAECVKICADSMGASEDTVQAAFSVADWKTGMTDTMLDSIAKAVKKKGYEMTPDQIKAACPLIPWMDAELGD